MRAAWGRRQIKLPKGKRERERENEKECVSERERKSGKGSTQREREEMCERECMNRLMNVVCRER